jgi:hypothetical protein
LLVQQFDELGSVPLVLGICFILGESDRRVALVVSFFGFLSVVAVKIDAFDVLLLILWLLFERAQCKREDIQAVFVLELFTVFHFVYLSEHSLVVFESVKWVLISIFASG